MWPAIAVVVLSPKNPALRFDDISKRQSIERDEGREIDGSRNEHEARGEMIISEIEPQVRPVPVVGIAVGEHCAPALHQTNYGHDDDADGQREQSTPFAGDGETEC